MLQNMEDDEETDNDDVDVDACFKKSVLEKQRKQRNENKLWTFCAFYGSSWIKSFSRTFQNFP